MGLFIPCPFFILPAINYGRKGTKNFSQTKWRLKISFLNYDFFDYLNTMIKNKSANHQITKSTVNNKL